MKALVTGGAGFIGFHLARHLAEQGQDVTLCDNFARGKEDAMLKELQKKSNVTFVKVDLEDPSEFRKLGQGYDYVYHLAAINGTRNFYEIPHKVLRANVLSAINILDWFVKAKHGKILFSSSSETYAGSMGLPGFTIPTKEDAMLTINDVTNPRWSYAGSKIIGELFFLNYARVHGFPMSIIRYHNIYGPRMGYAHVIPEFSIRLLKGEDPFSIMGGKETRAFCYIEDGVRATQAVMECEKANGEIIHVGNQKEEIAMTDLAALMFRIAGKSPQIEIKPAPKGSVMRRCPDTSKLKRLTGFEAKVTLKEGVKKTYEWYKEDHLHAL